MSDYSGNSDDEYGPIASAWGDQVTDPPNNDNEIDVVAGWRALSDPNAKIGPSGLGSGGLHRQGKNYKPVDEEQILQHRMNGAGLGAGSKQNKQKKRSGTAAKGDTKQRFSRQKGPQQQPQRSNSSDRSTAQPRPHLPMTAPPTVKNNSKDHYQASRRPTERHAPPATQSAWSNQSLVDKPFWETTSPSPRNNAPSSPSELQYRAEKNPTASVSEKLVDTSWSKDSTVDHRPQKEFSSTTSQDSSAKRWTDWSSVTASSEDGWQTSKNWQHSLEDGWGQSGATDTKFSTQPLQQLNGDWTNIATTTTAATTTTTPTTSRSDDNYGWQAHNSKTNNAGLQTTATKDSQPRPAHSSGRFSNPRRPKYSHRNETRPLPVNYRAGVPLEPPKEVAPPPPIDNPVLITINVELEEGNKIPVEIRLHDDPKQLAYQFGRNHLITSKDVLDALRNLFQAQKNNAMKRRRRRPM